MSSTTIIWYIFSQIFFWSVIKSCDVRKDQTEFAMKLSDSIISSHHLEPLRLPRRLLGDIYLKRGVINNMSNLRLLHVPVHQICFNESLAAIQLKYIANNVTFSYDWVFGDDESWGIATLSSQNVYIDIDIEQAAHCNPKLLGMYISDFINTQFEVDVHGTLKISTNDVSKTQIVLASRAALVRDAELVLSAYFSPKIDQFIKENKFKLN